MPASASSSGSPGRLWLVGPLSCVVVALVAGWSVARDVGSPPAGGGREAGDEQVADLYRRDCAVCHGAEAQGTRRGPNLAGSGLALVDYEIRTGRMPIDEPGDEVVRSEPAYDPATIDALVGYVGELQDGAVADGPGIPEVDVAAGDVGAGGEVWRRECAACHAWSGSGGAMLDRAAPDVRDATPREMAEAVRSGPGEMPEFGAAAMGDDELEGLAAYFDEELRDPEDPGGWSIGHIGPVAEGAVALIAGLGLLAVAARLISGVRGSG